MVGFVSRAYPLTGVACICNRPDGSGRNNLGFLSSSALMADMTADERVGDGTRTRDFQSHSLTL
jgi:hypothetical protein